MQTKSLPNGAGAIVLTSNEITKYCGDVDAPQMNGVTLNRRQVEFVAQRAPWLKDALKNNLAMNGETAAVILSEQSREYETVHECVHFGQIGLSGVDNDSTLLIDPSLIPPLCQDQRKASVALVQIVDQFRPYFESTTPLPGYFFTAREYLTEVVAHVLTGDSLMAHVRGWATPEDYSGECSLVRMYRKVVQRERAQEWQRSDIGIPFLIDLFQQFESGLINPVHCKIGDGG